MRVIHLELFIRAPRERVFDLARSIDAHQASTEGTHERAVAGVTTGLIELGQQVTWEARHFGIRQRLTVRIIGFDRPNSMEDEMVRGAFKHFRHLHTYEARDGGTWMRDRFEFSAPLGPLGWIAERLFLERYMRGFLHRRALVLKQIAETDAWRQFLSA